MNLLVLIFSCASLTTFAQFGPARVVQSGGANPGFYHAMASGDLTGDGFPDIIASRSNPWRLELYVNTGNETFSTPSQVSYGIGRIRSLAIMDADGNQQPDIIFGTEEGLLAYLPRNNGQFGSPVILDTSVDFSGMPEIIVEDMDRDGIPDLLLLEHFFPSLKRGLPAGGFADRSVLIDSARFTEYYSLGVGHFNSDTLPDFVIGAGGFHIYTGNGASFDHDSSYAEGLVMNLAVARLNSDGNADLLIQNAHQFKSFLSSPSGALQAPVLFQPGNAHYTGFTSLDVDMDGDEDVVAIYDQQDRIVWFRNNGLGVFQGEQVIHEVPGAFLSQLLRADINRDGRMDIVWAGTNGILGFHLNAGIASSITSPDMHSLQVYPNPARGSVQVQVARKGLLYIHDAAGRLVIEQRIEAGTHRVPVPQTTGIYFIGLISGNKTYRTELVIH
ncbi:MAG TPA: T9SS type A sorting domain-containing protein [Flavisolibacter sp.]